MGISRFGLKGALVTREVSGQVERGCLHLLWAGGRAGREFTEGHVHKILVCRRALVHA